MPQPAIVPSHHDTAPVAPNGRLPAPARRHRAWSSDTLETAIAATTPAILRLLEDGVPRSRRTLVQALAASHAKADVTCTLMRLAVTGRLDEAHGRYSLPSEPGPDRSG